MKTYALTILLLMGITGCTDNGNQSSHSLPQGVPSNAQKQYCYVLCDFSGSQDSLSMDVIAENARTILSKAKQYNIRYINIASQQLERPFFQNDPKVVDEIETPSEKRIRQDRDNGLIDTLTNRMIRLRHASGAQGTCIITAIDKVCRSLEREVSKKDVIKVIILSDMQEDCTYSYGKINIDRASFNSAFKTLAKMPKPKYTFGSYKNFELTIVGSSQKSINIAELDSFWTKVFAKYEISSEALIVVDLPKWVTDAE